MQWSNRDTRVQILGTWCKECGIYHFFSVTFNAYELDWLWRRWGMRDRYGQKAHPLYRSVSLEFLLPTPFLPSRTMRSPNIIATSCSARPRQISEAADCKCFLSCLPSVVESGNLLFRLDCLRSSSLIFLSAPCVKGREKSINDYP